MRTWSYAKRLTAVRGHRSHAEIARILSALTGRKIGGQLVKNWESGSTPRAVGQIEKWIREREQPKPLAAPRPQIGFSFSMFLDTATTEEARGIVAMLNGFVSVIQARWPETKQALQFDEHGRIGDPEAVDAADRGVETSSDQPPREKASS